MTNVFFILLSDDRVFMKKDLCYFSVQFSIKYTKKYSGQNYFFNLGFFLPIKSLFQNELFLL